MELKIAYLGLTLFTVLFLGFIGFIAIGRSSHKPNRDKILLTLSLLIWQVFIFVVSSQGILKSYEFPPRFAIIFVIPSFIFTGVFLTINRNKNWIRSIPEHWVVYFQSFRILVETLFVFGVAKGILHYQVTIEGYNYDMIFALTAPIVAFLVYHKKVFSRKLILLWNYLGLTVIASIIFLFMTSIYVPEIYGSEIPLLPLESLSYPYILIPGFLMPTAVFLHILSIIQVSK